MLLSVNPTRMELLRLRQRLVLARRGHKLLKDKLEGLMRSFLSVASSYIEKREIFDRKYRAILNKYYISTADMTNDQIEKLFSKNNFSLEIISEEESVMNVRYPVFEIKTSGIPISYPFAFTRDSLDSVMVDLMKLLPSLIELASIQQEIYLIALEIAKTRRRVNALEYVMIPNLEETTKYIYSKLEEMERSNISRLLKIKDIIRGH